METLSGLNIVESFYHKLGFSYCSYSLPVKNEIPRCYINENTSHVGRDKFAMDIIVPVGTIVYAPAGGKIVLLEQFYSEASHRPEDGDKVNQIRVRTGTNETYELKHIGFKRCKFKIGDYIPEGVELTVVDLNGYYIQDGDQEFPSHLHFAVHKDRSNPLKVRFKEYDISYGKDGSVVFKNK